MGTKGIGKERLMVRRFRFCQVFADLRELEQFAELTDYELFKMMDGEYRKARERNPFCQSSAELTHQTYHAFAVFRSRHYTHSRAHRNV